MVLKLLKWNHLLYLLMLKALKKKAACLLTVSDSLVTHEATTAQERQEAFTKMMEVALNSL